MDSSGLAVLIEAENRGASVRVREASPAVAAHHPGDRSAAPPEAGAVNRSRAFAARPDSIRQARTFVEDALAGTELAALQSIVLMVSELATNSVRHAGSEFTVDVGSADDAVRVVVADRGAGAPQYARALARRADRPRSADRRPPGRRMGHRRRLGRVPRCGSS